MNKKIILRTSDYILFKNSDDIYVLRYFDECITSDKFNPHKKVLQSRISKDVYKLLKLI